MLPDRTDSIVILFLQILGVAVAGLVGLIAMELRRFLIASIFLALAIWQCVTYWPAP